MNKEPIPIVGEWTISTGYPGTLGKTAVSHDPFMNHSKCFCATDQLEFHHSDLL